MSRSYEVLKSDILYLSNNCKFLRSATTDDITYTAFQELPEVAESDIDDGMYWRVNRTMDAVFGADVIDKNLFIGCYGMEFVLKWLSKAREHATWDINSDQLLNIKLDNIRAALISES